MHWLCTPILWLIIPAGYGRSGADADPRATVILGIAFLVVFVVTAVGWLWWHLKMRRR